MSADWKKGASKNGEGGFHFHWNPPSFIYKSYYYSVTTFIFLTDILASSHSTKRVCSV